MNKVRPFLGMLVVAACLCGVDRASDSQMGQSSGTNASYLGFDRNEYPGDENLAALRKTFSFAGYWLNVPPGAATNTWTGKRETVRAARLGFLVLFNGRLDAELKKTTDAGELGKSDAAVAVAAAAREGFPRNTLIFLDVEEGGRMLPEQKAYIYAWVDGVLAAGFRAGVYCSGIPAKEAHGVTVVTADELRQNAGDRNIVYWVTNDACPPSPGCSFSKQALPPSGSGVGFAEVWQFAQSPKRRDVARGCRANYDHDGSCYAPGLATGQRIFIDVDSASVPDPSGGR
jgi:Domain of unknown function (DUF1906)